MNKRDILLPIFVVAICLVTTVIMDYVLGRGASMLFHFQNALAISLAVSFYKFLEEAIIVRGFNPYHLHILSAQVLLNIVVHAL